MWGKANYVLASAGDGPWSWDHLGWYWGMGMHGLFWLVFLILAVVAVVVVVRALAGGGSAVKAPSDQAADDLRNSARVILDTRYAWGEIERDEFLTKKQDLTA